MLDDIKKVAGINHSEFDFIIQKYIETAKLDLEMVGIAKSNITESDKLIYSAIMSYVMSFLDVDNSELYCNSYALQKDALRHYPKYISEKSVGE